MTEEIDQVKEPLWLLIEKQIQGCADDDFNEANIIPTSRKIAEVLDETGYNVSKHGGNWLQLTAAVKARSRVGRPFIQDFEQAISSLSLDDTQDTYATAMKVIRDLGNDWPAFLDSKHRPDVDEIVGNRKTDLMVARARELAGEKGIRYLIYESFEPQAICEALGVSDEEYQGVKAKVDAEFAEKARVQELFDAVEDASEEEKIKHLLNNNAEDGLITEIGGIEQSAIDAVKKAMEEELAEKKRKEEELAAKKAAEAEGPALEDISAEDMLTHIEGIREILEFSDVEKDIRTMCEQSAIPKALVDIAISDPAKLDEMEKEAEG
jgi:hypothetical protein